MKGGKKDLGTESSPLLLFSGLQRSVTTVLRPDSQDEVVSKDLTEKQEKKKKGKTLFR